ncbi:MAG: hypothetical protein ACTHJ5_15310 [Ilyomonas sp.]
MHEDLIPESEKGGSTNTVHDVTEETEAKANQVFNKAVHRLLNIDHWSDFAGLGSSVFKLTDEHGDEVNREPKVGDHMKINLPGPDSHAGGGFDWVRIEAIADKRNPNALAESFSMRARPCANPKSKDDKSIAHFFKEDATSTFIIKREGKKVSAEVRGRNEIPNTSTHDTVDKLRNTFVAIPAILGLSNGQWKKLVFGFLD